MTAMIANQTLPVLASPSLQVDAGLVVQLRPFPCETSPAFEAAWYDLERRSLERNPFLSPAFLFPQCDWQESSTKAQLLTIMDGQGNWLLAGLFDRVWGTRQLPLPHLQAVRTQHTYKTGLLMDATDPVVVVETLWKFLREQHLHGLSFPIFPVQSELAGLLIARCEKGGTTVTIEDLHARAVVSASEGAVIAPHMEKRLRRARRDLEKFGKVSVRFTGCLDGDLSAMEQFLFLESLGWKGDEQTALACLPHEVEAMKRVALEFAAQDRIRFAELTLDERVIASMCLFRAEEEYFFFKVGWDPQFKRGCPGFLLAVELQNHLAQLPGCERIDGCAKAGSYLENVWSDRQEIGTVLFTTTWCGATAARGTRWTRDLYRRFRKRATPPLCPPEQVSEES